MSIKHGKHLTEPCPKCNGRNMKTKAARQCWECRYSDERRAIKHCTKCGKKLTSRNWLMSCKARKYNICIKCFNIHAKDKYQERKLWYAKKHLSLKMDVISHYGGKCSCCGISEHVFLTLDHVNGDGAAHRRQLGVLDKSKSSKGTGKSIYAWIVNHDFPDTFQVLCWNCNWAKSHGGCPHQGIVEEKPAEQPKTKSYPCNKCHEVFDHHGKLANHIRYVHPQYATDVIAK